MMMVMMMMIQLHVITLKFDCGHDDGHDDGHDEIQYEYETVDDDGHDDDDDDDDEENDDEENADHIYTLPLPIRLPKKKHSQPSVTMKQHDSLEQQDLSMIRKLQNALQVPQQTYTIRRIHTESTQRTT